MTTFAAWPQYYNISDGSTLFSTWATGDWTASNCTFATSTTYTKLSSASLKVTPSTASATALWSKGIGTLSLDVAKKGVIGLWIYCENLPDATGSIALRISNDYASGTFFANFRVYTWTRVYDFTNGWNFIVVDLEEAGATAFGANSWSQTGAVSLASPMVRMEFTFSDLSGASIYFDSIVLNPRSRGKVVFGFDDTLTEYFMTTVVPLLTDRGIKAYEAITTRDTGATYVSRLNTLYALGWDICNHTTDHGQTGTGEHVTELATEAEVLERITPVEDFLRENGWTRGLGVYIATENKINETVKNALASVGFRYARSLSSGKRILTSYGGVPNPLEIGCMDLDQKTEAAAKGYLLTAARYGASVNIFVHDVVDDGDYNAGNDADPANVYKWPVSRFTNWLNYGVQLRNQGLLDFVTPSQWLTGLTQPQAVS